MGQPSSKDEMTIRHQFDRLCQMALKGEAVNYYKHMDYRRKHEVTFSELSEKELSKLWRPPVGDALTSGRSAL